MSSRIRHSSVPGTWRWLVICVIGFVLPTEPNGADAAEWPFHRGPGFDGHVPNERVRNSVPEDGPEVLWTRPLGKGYSGFVGSGDRIYTQHQTLGGQYVICLHARTGEVLWEHRYAFPYEHIGLYPGPRSTPTLHAGRVYFTGPLGELGCLNAKTGRAVWRRDLFEEFDVEPPEFGYSCSPVIVDETLYLPVGSPGCSLVAFDPATGRTRWQAGDDRISHVSVLPIRRDGERQFILYLRNSLVAFDDEGQLLWRRELSTGYDEHAAWPIYREPHLWITGPFKAGSEQLELRTEPAEVRTVWKSELLSNDVCSSVLYEGHLYGFDLREAQSKVQRPSRGTFRCLDWMTGEPRWSNGHERMRRRERDDPRFEGVIGHASVLVADDKLILLSDLGELIVAKANPERYEELWRTPLLTGEVLWTQPMLLEGCLYARNHSRVVCVAMREPESLDLATGQELLSVTEIPQSEYRDWAMTLLPVERYYSMDAPTLAEFQTNFATLVVLMFGAMLIVAVLCVPIRRAIERIKTADAGIPTSTVFRTLTLMLWFLIGLVGTTTLGHLADRFVMTWPLSLFVLVHLTLLRAENRNGMTRTRRVLDLLVVAAFLGFSLLYFFVCRRLSLAFDWCFLGSYPAAVPFGLLARRWRNSPVKEWTAVFVSWSAFFWTAYLITWFRYGV